MDDEIERTRGGEHIDEVGSPGPREHFPNEFSADIFEVVGDEKYANEIRLESLVCESVCRTPSNTSRAN